MYRCSEKNKQFVYFTLDRPKLEYVNAAWDPHTKNNITSLRKYNDELQDLYCNRWLQSWKQRNIDDNNSPVGVFRTLQICQLPGIIL